MLKKLALVLLFLATFLICFAQSPVRCVNKYVTRPQLTQGQFDALVDFTFNVGCGAFRKSTLLKDVNRGNMVAASGDFMHWIYVGNRPNVGLIHRRQLEQKRFGEK